MKNTKRLWVPNLTLFLLGVIMLHAGCTPEEDAGIPEIEMEFLSSVSDTTDLVEDGFIVQGRKKNLYSRYALAIPREMEAQELFGKIDSIMCSLYSDSLRYVESASYSFLKRSHVTNNENIWKRTKVYDEYSVPNDLLVQYAWDNGVIQEIYRGPYGEVDSIDLVWYRWDYDCSKYRPGNGGT